MYKCYVISYAGHNESYYYYLLLYKSHIFNVGAPRDWIQLDYSIIYQSNAFFGFHIIKVAMLACFCLGLSFSFLITFQNSAWKILMRFSLSVHPVFLYFSYIVPLTFPTVHIHIYRYRYLAILCSLDFLVTFWLLV